MKPTSEQTRNGVLSAVSLPEDLLKMRSFFRYVTDPSDVGTNPRPASVDPSTAFGCVDWFIYPEDPKSAHV
jgi:hypothetical protein